MKDMDVAVDRLNDAWDEKSALCVCDYDVDGCTAVALVYKFLQQFYSNIDYYIPDRYDEGYGVSYKGIDYAHETGVKLIIILDCGIKAISEIEYAKSLASTSLYVTITCPDEIMPPAVAILNPKRPDDSYPFKHLCGCGVGFKFMHFRQEQRHTILTFSAPARLLRSKYSSRHCARSGRKQNIGIPRS